MGKGDRLYVQLHAMLGLPVTRPRASDNPASPSRALGWLPTPTLLPHPPTLATVPAHQTWS